MMRKVLRYWLFWMLLAVCAVPAAAQRTELSSNETLYPRLVRLSHGTTGNGRIVASVTSFPSGKGEEQIFASDDSGRTFARIGTINDADFAKGLCCGTLYELPQAVGALYAGTLLWAGSVGGDVQGAPMQIKIFRSSDRGATWSYLSNCLTATVNRSAGGLWEPEFTIAADGSLVCFYSDETQVGHSQVLRLTRTTDGLHWSAPADVVSSGVAADRPGMAVVRRLPSGRYFMTFELCGPAACTVFYKTSADGLAWGAATDVGTRVETDDHRWFLHTPTNAWAAVPGLANGRIFVIGQIVANAAGIAPGNGQVVFYNDSADGSGPWKVLPAPVPINAPPTTSNVCQNYSSPLLPSENGVSLLGLATDYDVVAGVRTCKTYFGLASTTVAPTLTLTGGAINIARGQSGTSTITVEPGGGYRGTVNLSVSIPGYSGTISPSTLSFADGATHSATLTVPGTASATLAALLLAGGIGLSFLRGFRLLALPLAALALGSCGGGSGGSSGGSGSVTPPPPTVTTYNATVTATDTSNPAITSNIVIPVTVTG
ncbi:MAG: sialidase family protein [Sphingomonas sp.]|uniref:sialidase family protein n=1 Tax=Sphingomonas sp. TaxID=28214 RepID=UPI003F80B02E